MLRELSELGILSGWRDGDGEIERTSETTLARMILVGAGKGGGVGRARVTVPPNASSLWDS